MKLETVIYEVQDSVATISFNRPEVRNAFNAQMTGDILSAVKEAENDTNIRCVILTGKGLGFSAGADLTARDGDWKDTEDALIRGYMPSLQSIINMPKPVISAVNGAAAEITGFGMFIMLCKLGI
jgi:2-(1,2-epoxy-1,2-dihydrophenyl)acetyl-CoA isomerase